MAQHLANCSLVIIYFCCIVQAPTDDTEKKMKQMESQSLYCLMQRPQYYQKTLSHVFPLIVFLVLQQGYMDNHFIVQYSLPTLGVELHSLLTNQPCKYYYKPYMKIPQMHNLSLFKKFKIKQYKQQIILKLKL